MGNYTGSPGEGRLRACPTTQRPAARGRSACSRGTLAAMHTMPRAPCGATLLHLLLGVALLACLYTLAVPPLQALWHALQAEHLRLQLHAGFARARTSALSQRRTLAVCASADGQRCGNDWSAGWMIYPAPSSRAPPDGRVDEVIFHHRHAAVRGLRAAVAATRPRLLFHADGRSGNSNQTVVICLHGQRHGQVVVNVAGRVRSQRARGRQPC